MGTRIDTQRRQSEKPLTLYMYLHPTDTLGTCMFNSVCQSASHQTFPAHCISITFSQRCAHLIHCHTSFHSSSSGTELTTGSGLVSFIVCFGSWYAIISLGVQVRIETQKWSCWCFVTIG